MRPSTAPLFPSPLGLPCTQHPCLLTCAANALGTLVAHFASIQPHMGHGSQGGLPSGPHGPHCPDADTMGGPAVYCTATGKQSATTPVPAPPTTLPPLDVSQPITATLGPLWDQWLSAAAPDPPPPASCDPGTSPASDSAPSSPESAEKSISSRTTTEPIQSSSSPHEPRTTDELIHVIANQERTILDLEAKCQALMQQLESAQQKNQAIVHQLEVKLDEANQGLATATQAAQAAGAAADEALGAVTVLYQQASAARVSKRSKGVNQPIPSLRPAPSTMTPAPNGPRRPTIRPPDPSSNCRTAVCAGGQHAPEPDPAVPLSPPSTPWSIIDGGTPPAFPTGSILSEAASSDPPPQGPSLSPVVPQQPSSSPIPSTLTRTFWPAGATLGLGLTYPKPAPANYRPK